VPQSRLDGDLRTTSRHRESGCGVSFRERRRNRLLCESPLPSRIGAPAYGGQGNFAPTAAGSTAWAPNRAAKLLAKVLPLEWSKVLLEAQLTERDEASTGEATQP
jgi:hypothetical protein